MLSFSEIETRLTGCGQSHVLHHWAKLTPDERDGFLKQLSSLDFQEMNLLFQRAQEYRREVNRKPDDQMHPIPPHRLEAADGIPSSILEEYRALGMQEIAENRVAVILLAGGQGTRLGVTYPKGMFPLEIPSGKTLFQLQAERIRKVTELSEEKTEKLGKICWYIMTSAATHEDTANYLEKHRYFGLNKENVVLFQQSLLPCFTMDGKFILEKKDCIALAPDGNGGIYSALRKHNIIADMERRGVKYIHIHSVDNILVKVADPEFIGYCVKKKADCAVKVVPKLTPNEPVGVVCEVNGIFQVVEYSELNENTANRRTLSGSLVFKAGNICNHIFRIDFLKNLSEFHADDLTLHVAPKKIPYMDENGEIVRPTIPNGIKIEKFIFDVFPLSENFVAWEVPRYTDFSPLKNESGKDSPVSCRRDLIKLHKKYVRRAGGTIKCVELEISPLLSYAGENLHKYVDGKTFDSRTLLVSDHEHAPDGGETADLGQFPWMTLLGYRQKQLDFIEYLCGGTIITETYVLTAAHCIGVGKHHKLVHVRLGEHDTRSATDCHILHGKKVCADKPVDIPVLTSHRHPHYDIRTLKNDIALVRLKKIVKFTDFIQPICLPFERSLEKKVLTGQKFTVSGWGKTDSRKLGGSPVLQFATVSVWDHNECNRVVPPEVQPITNSQLCANGKKEDACKGDSGGPLVNSTVDIDGEVRNFQIGIVSFASTLTCGVEELPPIYTRVDTYLEWIADNVN